MINPENQSRGSIEYRARRCHQKSRTGCRECKRRRIKVGKIQLNHPYRDRTNSCYQCDEKKPSCTRCVLSLHSCVYLPTALFVVESGRKDEQPLPSPQRCTPSLSPITPSFSDNSLFSEASAYSTPPLMEASCHIEAKEDSLPPSDTALYHHYLQHTSHITTHYQNDKPVLEIYVPTLALQSKIVFHSILALSAACLCRDMIAERPPPDIAAVNQVLMAGYRHYNLASEKTRDLISQSNTLRPEPLLASAPFLIGFATASQQINHWIESRKSTRKPSQLLFASLRDTIIIIKGLRATLHVLRRDHVSSSHKMAYEPEVPNDIALTLMESKPPLTSPPPSHTHVMYSIFATTSQEAFSRLQERLHSTSLYHGDNAFLAACAEAFHRLSTIRNLTFSSSAPSTPLSLDNASMLPQLPPWLRSYIGRPVILLPNEPLVRPFLTFLIHSSQEYLDLLLPLLDESLESPLDSIPDGSPELTEVQALTLDIWAHWCVLMFLVEEEAWWIGNLPYILLTGMLNRYGNNFVARLWPGDGQGQGRWWPASMLACLREVKRC
jgi:Fungal specific transcription factor domain